MIGQTGKPSRSIKGASTKKGISGRSKRINHGSVKKTGLNSENGANSIRAKLKNRNLKGFQPVLTSGHITIRSTAMKKDGTSSPGGSVNESSNRKSAKLTGRNRNCSGFARKRTLKMAKESECSGQDVECSKRLDTLIRLLLKAKHVGRIRSQIGESKPKPKPFQSRKPKRKPKTKKKASSI